MGEGAGLTVSRCGECLGMGTAVHNPVNQKHQVTP